MFLVCQILGHHFLYSILHIVWCLHYPWNIGYISAKISPKASITEPTALYTCSDKEFHRRPTMSATSVSNKESWCITSSCYRYCYFCRNFSIFQIVFYIPNHPTVEGLSETMIRVYQALLSLFSLKHLMPTQHRCSKKRSSSSSKNFVFLQPPFFFPKGNIFIINSHSFP